MRPKAIFFALAIALTPGFAARALFAQAPNEDGVEEFDPASEPKADSSASPPAPRAAIVPRPNLPTKDGMVRLPGGRFTMGSADRGAAPNERPAHLVSLAPFWLDKTEVTVAKYRACVDAHACGLPEKTSPSCTFDLGEPELPISCVAWKEADAYCRFVGKRLPREAEWEYAARGTARVRFPWGAFPSCTYAVTLLNEATGRSCGKRHPAVVGTHPAGASVFGVLDLSGNVEEWTSDWYVESLAEGALPRAGSAHVLRGGGWLSPPSMSRTTARNWGSSIEAGPNVGLRCAKDG
jgi:formylglycine-generating enzyme required for sulfatase activity